MHVKLSKKCLNHLFLCTKLGSKIQPKVVILFWGCYFTDFIKSTDYRPTDHQPLTHQLTDPPTTDPPTNQILTDPIYKILFERLNNRKISILQKLLNFTLGSIICLMHNICVCKLNVCKRIIGFYKIMPRS